MQHAGPARCPCLESRPSQLTSAGVAAAHTRFLALPQAWVQSVARLLQIACGGTDALPASVCV